MYLRTLLIAIIALIFTSCSNSNVVSNGIIQKRKYQKGFHFKSIGLTKNNVSGENSALRAVKGSKPNDTGCQQMLKKNNILEIKYSKTERTLSDSTKNTYIIKESRKNQYNYSTKTRDLSKIKVHKTVKLTSSKMNGVIARKSSKTVPSFEKTKPEGMSTGRVILLVLCLLYLTPLAVYIVRGAGRKFWISLAAYFGGILIFILFFGVPFLLVLGVLIYLFGIVFSWISVFR